MDSTKCSLKSLRNILLEKTAINFHKVFMSSDLKNEATKVKSHICLTPRLFEDVLWKGKEMSWMISAKCLKSCLAFIDALHWMDINLFHYEVTDDDLKVISESGFPVRSLSICMHAVTDKSFEYLGKLASLETLEIYPVGNSKRYNVNSGDSTNPSNWLSLPKLKKLVIVCKAVRTEHVAQIDLEPCLETLEVLRLEGLSNGSTSSGIRDIFFNHFISSIGSLKKLRSLSLDYLDLNGIERDLMSKIRSLKSLRFLSLRKSSCSSVSRKKFKHTLCKLPELETVDITDTEFKNCERFKTKGTSLENVLASLNKEPIDNHQGPLPFPNFTKPIEAIQFYHPHYSWGEDDVYLIISRLKWVLQSFDKPSTSELVEFEMKFVTFIEWFCVSAADKNTITSRKHISDILDCHQWGVIFLRKITNLILSKCIPQEKIHNSDPDFIKFHFLLSSLNLLKQMLKDILSCPNSSRSKFIVNFMCHEYGLCHGSLIRVLNLGFENSLCKAGIVQIMNDIANNVSGLPNVTQEIRMAASEISKDAANSLGNSLRKYKIVTRCLEVLTSICQDRETHIN